MTTADLYAIIYLGAFILAVYLAAVKFNSWCPKTPREAAWDDAAKALRRANRDVETRDRLKLTKE